MKKRKTQSFHFKEVIAIGKLAESHTQAKIFFQIITHIFIERFLV